MGSEMCIRDRPVPVPRSFSRIKTITTIPQATTARRINELISNETKATCLPLKRCLRIGNCPAFASNSPENESAFIFSSHQAAAGHPSFVVCFNNPVFASREFEQQIVRLSRHTNSVVSEKHDFRKQMADIDYEVNVRRFGKIHEVYEYISLKRLTTVLSLSCCWIV